MVKYLTHKEMRSRLR
jgi:RNase H-fold protein (predicted Holliday junction resolvase)